MSLKSDPKFKLTLLASSLVFFCFAVPAVYNGSQTQQARRQAQYYFNQLQIKTEECAEQAQGVICEGLADSRMAFDRQVLVANQKFNATKIFLVFAIFVPLLIWVAFFLTRIVFKGDHEGRNF